MNPLQLVRLTDLMTRTDGRPEINIGLIDGPVALNHPALANERIRKIPGDLGGSCGNLGSTACAHGTFVAGILAASRESSAPAICPNCTLLVRTIFSEEAPGNSQMPSATPQALAAALIDCVDASAKVINLSVALEGTASSRQRDLEEALDYAAKRGVIVVAAAGNEGTVGGSVITAHLGVIPVVACDPVGRPINQSNVGKSIGRRGLCAPGDKITSLGVDGGSVTSGGTSAAAPIVTGAISLLWSEFPTATAAQMRSALAQELPRRSVVPPLLNAWAAYQAIKKVVLN